MPDPSIPMPGYTPQEPEVIPEEVVVALQVLYRHLAPGSDLTLVVTEETGPRLHLPSGGSTPEVTHMIRVSRPKASATLQVRQRWRGKKEDS